VRTLSLGALVFVVGFASGAWLAGRSAPSPAVAPRALQPGVAPATTAPRADGAPAAGPMGEGASSPLDRPPAAAPSPALAAENRLMPEPPASWMSVEQQRAAAAAYREWVRDAGRLAMERTMGLNAELFMIESQDPAWGAQMEAKVRASMAGSPVFDGAQLEAIECRVTVCRATLRFVEADNPRGLLQNGGRSPWSEWRNAQIQPVRTEINDGVPGFRATVYLGEDFDQPRLPRGVRAAGPGGP
jgi:hypothetical protein